MSVSSDANTMNWEEEIEHSDHNGTWGSHANEEGGNEFLFLNCKWDKNVKGMAKDGTDDDDIWIDASVNIWNKQDSSVMLQQLLLPDVHNEYEIEKTDYMIPTSNAA